jgi:hypothetical protein
MTLLTEAEYLQRRLNSLHKKMSSLTYGPPRYNKAYLAKKNALHAETRKVREMRNNALKRNRTIMHHNMNKTYGPGFNRASMANMKKWQAMQKNANRYANIIPKAQALRNKILRRKAINVVRQHWYKPPVPGGRGYQRLLSTISKNFKK